MNIFVSNLGAAVTGQQVSTLFSGFGLVQSAVIIRHGNGQKLNNGCWLVMADEHDAEQAIRSLDESIFMQQPIAVDQAIFALHNNHK